MNIEKELEAYRKKRSKLAEDFFVKFQAYIRRKQDHVTRIDETVEELKIERESCKKDIEKAIEASQEVK